MVGGRVDPQNIVSRDPATVAGTWRRRSSTGSAVSSPTTSAHPGRHGNCWQLLAAADARAVY